MSIGCPHIQQMASSGCLWSRRRSRWTLFFQVRECACGVFLLMVVGSYCWYGPTILVSMVVPHYLYTAL